MSSEHIKVKRALVCSFFYLHVLAVADGCERQPEWTHAGLPGLPSSRGTSQTVRHVNELVCLSALGKGQ